MCCYCDVTYLNSTAQTVQNRTVNSQFVGLSFTEIWSFFYINQPAQALCRSRKHVLLPSFEKKIFCELSEFIWKDVEVRSSSWPPTWWGTWRILLGSINKSVNFTTISIRISMFATWLMSTALSVRLFFVEILRRWPVGGLFISSICSHFVD